MVTINQDGLVPVAAVHPRVMATFKKVKEFQLAVRQSTGAQDDRRALYTQFEGWLHDLKVLTLVAYRYREQHDWMNKVDNPFEGTDECPADATPEQRFRYENNLVATAMRLELETFHVYTSTLLDRVARIFGVYFVPAKAVQARTHEALLKVGKRNTAATYITPTLMSHANWLQDNVDSFRNRAIIHPEGHEKDGYFMKGLKSRSRENIRAFIRARKEFNGVITEMDRVSETMEAIVDRLCAYVDAVIDALGQHYVDSILEDPTGPRPERVV